MYEIKEGVRPETLSCSVIITCLFKSSSMYVCACRNSSPSCFATTEENMYLASTKCTAFYGHQSLNHLIKHTWTKEYKFSDVLVRINFRKGLEVLWDKVPCRNIFPDRWCTISHLSSCPCIRNQGISWLLDRKKWPNSLANQFSIPSQRYFPFGGLQKTLSIKKSAKCKWVVWKNR